MKLKVKMKKIATPAVNQPESLIASTWLTLHTTPMYGPLKGPIQPRIALQRALDSLHNLTSVVLSLDSDSVSGQCRSAIGPKVDNQHVLSMCFCLLHFRLMVGREVEEPL